MPESEPTKMQRELIELEVKRAIAKEVEGYRKTLENHQAYVEKSTKWFASAVVALAGVAAAIFFYFFGRSVNSVPDLVKSEVRDSSILAEIKKGVELNTSFYVPQLTSDATNKIALALRLIQSDLVRSAETNLSQRVSESTKTLLDGEFKERLDQAATNWLAKAVSLTADEKLRLLDAVPIGTIVAYAGPNVNPKSGWLICDGTSLLQKDYPRLFDAIKTTWGASAGTNTFNLPDLRGMFLRGVDSEGRNDPDYLTRINSQGQQVGAVVGSFQPDAFKSHSHTSSSHNNPPPYGGTEAKGKTTGRIGGQFEVPWLDLTTSVGGNETRPKNAYVYYIIKY